MSFKPRMDLWRWWGKDEDDGPPCLETDTSPVIEVRVFHHPGDEDIARVVRDYVQGALLESFDCRALVDISETTIPRDVTSHSGFKSYTEDENLGLVKDCNVLIHGGQKYGGGRHAITMAHYLEQLVDDDCPKLYGSGDAHASVQEALHEVGHCLGLPHAHETDGYPVSHEGKGTPMGSYIDSSQYLHRYHPVITVDDIDIA